jgi:hypothetical protein
MANLIDFLADPSELGGEKPAGAPSESNPG